jgi:hypothetical protein
MSERDITHIVGVTAVWIIFLSSIRFAAVGLHGLRPVAKCIWHLIRCDGQDKESCRRRLIRSLDKQYTELLAAITTKWSVVLLFTGMVLIGAGLSMGSVGDVAQLVAVSPSGWAVFDRGMDLLSAGFLACGMASIHAAVTKRRSLSLLVSGAFAIMGAGIGYFTVSLP